MQGDNGGNAIVVVDVVVVVDIMPSAACGPGVRHPRQDAVEARGCKAKALILGKLRSLKACGSRIEGS